MPFAAFGSRFAIGAGCAEIGLSLASLVSRASILRCSFGRERLVRFILQKVTAI
jgi:hypothetical protein